MKRTRRYFSVGSPLWPRFGTKITRRRLKKWQARRARELLKAPPRTVTYSRLIVFLDGKQLFPSTPLYPSPFVSVRVREAPLERRI